MLTRERFAALAEKYMDMVFRVAYGYMRSRDDADDITQDVLLRLYCTDTLFDSEEHVRNWLIRVTVNQCKKGFPLTLAACGEHRGLCVNTPV